MGQERGYGSGDLQVLGQQLTANGRRIYPFALFRRQWVLVGRYGQQLIECVAHPVGRGGAGQAGFLMQPGFQVLRVSSSACLIERRRQAFQVIDRMRTEAAGR